MKNALFIAALIGSVATSYGLTVKIGSTTINDNVFPDFSPGVDTILSMNRIVDGVKVNSVGSASTSTVLDLVVSFGNQFSGSPVSKPLTISTETDVTLTGPLSFTANIGGQNAANGSSYFLAYLDSTLFFDSRTAPLLGHGSVYGSGDYSGNHYVVPGTFGTAGSTYNLQLLAFLDVPAATTADLFSRGDFNASLNFQPATLVPDAGATLALLALAFGSLAAFRRK